MFVSDVCDNVVGSYRFLGRQFVGKSFGLRVFKTRHKKRSLLLLFKVV